MKIYIKNTCFIIIIFLLLSCKSKNIYVSIDYVNKYGVDFTKGKWLLNELDCPKENKDELALLTATYFKEKLQDNLHFSIEEKGLLLAQKSYFNPDKTALKDLKKGTGYDFFINVVAKKNKNEMAGFQILRNESPGTNESEVYLEIYDLNKLEIVYSDHVIGTFKKETRKINRRYNYKG
jgi:hypothetical protein